MSCCNLLKWKREKKKKKEGQGPQAAIARWKKKGGAEGSELLWPTETEGEEEEERKKKKKRKAGVGGEAVGRLWL
jgi:hypothetical protein